MKHRAALGLGGWGGGRGPDSTHSGSVQKSQHPLPPALEGQWGQHVRSLLDIQALRKAGGGGGEGWQWPSGAEPAGRWELSRQEWTKPQATSAPDPPPQDLAAGRREREQKRGPGPLVHEQRSVLPRGLCGGQPAPLALPRGSWGHIGGQSALEAPTMARAEPQGETQPVPAGSGSGSPEALGSWESRCPQNTGHGRRLQSPPQTRATVDRAWPCCPQVLVWPSEGPRVSASPCHFTAEGTGVPEGGGWSWASVAAGWWQSLVPAAAATPWSPPAMPLP